MSDKKDTILTVALQLFAERGYDSTPTSLIAKKADVSEGLIFRHFQNKEGLMKAILTLAEEKVLVFIEEIEKLDDPKDQLNQIIELPYQIIQQNSDYWKVLSALKYQYKTQNNYTPQYVLRLNTLLFDIFSELNYPKPQLELLYFMAMIEGLSSMLLASPEAFNYKALVKFIKEKYRN